MRKNYYQKRPKVELLCNHCGGNFMGWKSRRFCSKECCQTFCRRKSAALQFEQNKPREAVMIEDIPFDGPVRELVYRVCKSFEVSYPTLVSKDRRRVVQYPRHVLTYAALSELSLSERKTAEIIGRDRSTVNVNASLVKDLMDVQDSVFLAYWNKYQQTA
jgi:hypothetical protein